MNPAYFTFCVNYAEAASQTFSYFGSKFFMFEWFVCHSICNNNLFFFLWIWWWCFLILVMYVQSIGIPIWGWWWVSKELIMTWWLLLPGGVESITHLHLKRIVPRRYFVLKHVNLKKYFVQQNLKTNNCTVPMKF